MNRVAFFMACAVISSVAFAQQNPDLKVGGNMYNLGFGSASQTCFDGSPDTKNGCVSKWIASNIYLSSSANSPVCVPSSSTICIGGAVPGSVPYLSDMYWIRDAVGTGQYEQSLLHFTQDTGFTYATGLFGMDQFDWFEQTNGLTEGMSYYVPSRAANGVLLYNGSTFVADLTQWAYGGAVTTVTYSGGVFTVTGTGAENFSNITTGKTITLAGFTSATFLNGKRATVTRNGGSTTAPTITFSLSCSANCTGTNETGYLANAQTIPSGNTLYISYMGPFDQVNVRLATARVGGSVSYQYSLGSGVWGDLTTAPQWSDGTGALRSGLSPAQIRFYPPIDWAQDVVHGSRSKFWVRISVSGATTSPAIFSLRGDNLHSTLNSRAQCGTLTNCLLRGWSESAYQASTACGGAPCVVAGGYQYNPSPPASASARFVYQARSGGYGGYNNNVWLNPSTVDSSTGNVLAGEVIPYLWTAAETASGVNLGNINGAVLDNAASIIGHMYPSWKPNLTDLACAPTCSDLNGNSSFDNYWATAFAQSTASFHSTYGSNFLVTGNVAPNWPSTLTTVGPSLDLSWLENPLTVTAGGNFQGSTTTAQNTFDLGLHGIAVSVAEVDSSKAGYCDAMYSPCIPFVWNRGARGSMIALGNHYLFGNPHTVLTYSVTGMSIYNFADQYYYFVDATTLTAPISRGVFPAPYALHVASTAPLVAMPSASCLQPGCSGTDNPFAGNIFVRICPTTSTCQEGDVFQVSQGGSKGLPSINILANSGTNVAIANSYVGTEKVQVAQYGHQAYTLPQNMPPWQNVMLYGTAAPAFRVDIGVPDTTNGWQPPAWNCGYSTCNRGDRDMYYGAGCTTLYCSAQQWSALPCVNGKYNSPLAGGRLRDCSPLARRDYTNAIVLMRTARTGGTLPTAPEEWTTYGKPIDLSSFEARCAPFCVYYGLRSDGTTDPGASSLTLRGSEAAILMKAPVTH